MERFSMRCTRMASSRWRFLARGGSPLIALAALAATFPAQTANVYWSGSGTSQGGSGTWDTTNPHFGTAGAGPSTITWNNTTNASDNVTFGGGDGTVTLGANITIKQLTFNTNYQTVAAGSGPYALNMSGANLSIGCGGAARGSNPGAISGLGSFIKAGSGTTILTAANTYAGTTSVTNGTLLVSGTIGPGAVAVSAGTLRGSGKVSGTATIGGTLSPGAAVGVFTLGSLILSSTSTSLTELSRRRHPQHRLRRRLRPQRILACLGIAFAAAVVARRRPVRG